MAKKKRASSKKVWEAKTIWGANKVSDGMGFSKKGKLKKAFAKVKF